MVTIRSFSNTFLYFTLSYTMHTIQVNAVNTLGACFCWTFWSSNLQFVSHILRIECEGPTSRNPVIDISSRNDSASSSMICSDTPMEFPSPADCLRIARTDKRFSDRNRRPWSIVCWFCGPRLSTAAQMTLIAAAKRL